MSLSLGSINHVFPYSFIFSAQVLGIRDNAFNMFKYSIQYNEEQYFIWLIDQLFIAFRPVLGLQNWPIHVGNTPIAFAHDGGFSLIWELGHIDTSPFTRRKLGY